LNFLECDHQDDSVSLPRARSTGVFPYLRKLSNLAIRSGVAACRLVHVHSAH
jgi:hypothetical protein